MGMFISFEPEEMSVREMRLRLRKPGFPPRRFWHLPQRMREFLAFQGLRQRIRNDAGLPEVKAVDLRFDIMRRDTTIVLPDTPIEEVNRLIDCRVHFLRRIFFSIETSITEKLS